MEEMLSYMAKELQSSRELFANATRAFRHQKAFNRRITVVTALLAFSVGALYKQNEELKRDLTKLREKGE